MGQKRNWNYLGKPPASGDCRKIVTLMDQDGMMWVGIRAFEHSRQIWINNNEPETARILAWRDLDEPARGRWEGGRLYYADDAIEDIPSDGRIR